MWMREKELKAAFLAHAVNPELINQLAPAEGLSRCLVQNAVTCLAVRSNAQTEQVFPKRDHAFCVREKIPIDAGRRCIGRKPARYPYVEITRLLIDVYGSRIGSRGQRNKQS